MAFITYKSVFVSPPPDILNIVRGVCQYSGLLQQALLCYIQSALCGMDLVQHKLNDWPELYRYIFVCMKCLYLSRFDNELFKLLQGVKIWPAILAALLMGQLQS